MARITLENITKKFGKVTALDDVSLDIKDKEFFVLFGPAGAGKTTILNCIAGIQLPEEGVVKFDDKIYSRLSRSSFSKNGRCFISRLNKTNSPIKSSLSFISA